MHKKILIILFSLGLALSFTSCNDEGVDRVCTPFVLPEGCQWKSDIEKEKVHRIDSREDLQELIEFVSEEQIPQINFDNTTILLVAQDFPEIGYSINSSLISTGRLSYILQIEAKKGDIMQPQASTLHIAVSTEKISKNAVINYQLELPY